MSERQPADDPNPDVTTKARNEKKPRPPRGRMHHRPSSIHAAAHGEPLSLAEEIAGDLQKGKAAPQAMDGSESDDQNVHIAELQKMSMNELIEEARKENLAEIAGMKKQDLIFKILKERVKMNGLMYGEGTLGDPPGRLWILAQSRPSLPVSCPDDIYVSPSQIRRFSLKTGATVSGQIRPPKENERYFALLRVEAINYQDPNEASNRINFDNLTPLHPDTRIMMETDDPGEP